jgi:hypothetical protein
MLEFAGFLAGLCRTSLAQVLEFATPNPQSVSDDRINNSNPIPNSSTLHLRTISVADASYEGPVGADSKCASNPQVWA